LTWKSVEQGWVLGTIGCGKKTCSEVIGTTNGGKSWGKLGFINSPISNVVGLGGWGVTELRFATPEVGWAFAPALYVTNDGGRSWTHEPVPGHGRQVLALATAASGAFAIVSDCPFGRGCSHQLSLWRTTAANGRSWSRIALNLPVTINAGVAVSGSTVYVLDSRSGRRDGPNVKDKLYVSTDDGANFSPRSAPCESVPGESLVQVVPTSETRVFLLCVGNPGFSQAEKLVYRSNDAGRTDASAGTLGRYGIQSQLAVSPGGDLVVASWSDGSFIYINDNHASHWGMPIGYSDGGAGWNDIAYVTDNEAWVVYAPPEFFSNLGKVLVTRDGGRHWSVVAL
jgi:photosystem II stability/assembly factor-like uncharacterized protein